MSDYDLIRRDNAYQKEIRRQKMTDAAKVGLLITQNIQQFQTNQILAQVQSEACRTNQFLGHMANTLDQIAHMQATHFEQVQRERSLKEVMFQFGKFLDETEECGDPAAAAFGIKRLFEILDRPSNGFSTADLSDLNDKKHFDALVIRAKLLLTGLPHDKYEELNQFEQLLGVYYERKKMGFNAKRAFPKKQHIELPAELQEPPAQQSEKDLAPLMRGGVAFLGAGCGVMMSGFGFLILLSSIVMLVDGDSGAVGGIVCVLPCLVAGPLLVWNFFRWRNANVVQNQRAEQERKAERQTQMNQWEEERKREETKAAHANQKIDAANVEMDEKRRQATKLFQATMEEMRSLLNKYLDQHPPIQKFVARV